MKNKIFYTLSRLFNSLDSYVIKNVFPLLKKFFLSIDKELRLYRYLIRIIHHYIIVVIGGWTLYYIYKTGRWTLYYIYKIGRWTLYYIYKTGRWTLYYIYKIGRWTRFKIFVKWLWTRHYISQIWLWIRIYIGRLEILILKLILKLIIFWSDLKILFQEIHILWLYLKKKLKEKYKK